MNRQGGFTLIELMIVVAVIAVIAAMAIPHLLGARKSANETSAISSLRTLSSINEQYRLRFLTFANSLDDLSTINYIDEVLGSGAKAGYTFNYTPGGVASWSCTADPQSVDDGDRRFFIDQSGVIRFHSSATAQSTDAPIH